MVLVVDNLHWADRSSLLLLELLAHELLQTRILIVAGPTVASYGAGARDLGILAAIMSRWQEER
jgi:predicted ATPase